jgi:vitamin-K-epoxide reductase (warfarin-sensitive)
MPAAMSASPGRLPFLISLVAVAGIAVSSLSLYHHFAKSKTSYCDFGESFNCDVVNRSQYSSIAGIPVAVLGMAGYGVILLLATSYRRSLETPGMLAVASLAGTAFALYLTYLEAFVLQAYCILCLSSLVMIVTIAALSTAWVFRARRA